MAENTVTTAPDREKEVAQTETMPATRDEARYVKPLVDIHETDDGLAVVADLPGVEHEGININVEHNILTIEAHTRQSTARGDGYYEFQLTNFYRQFQLDEKVDRDKITADFKNGVLTLNLPKAEEAKPRRIEVKVS